MTGHAVPDVGTSDASAAGPATEMRRALRTVLLGVVVFVAIIGTWTAVVLVSVRGDLQQARTSLTSIRDGDATQGDLGQRLASAERDLRRVQDRLHQPGPVLGAKLPVLGRTPDAVQRTVRATLAATVGLRGVVQAATEPGPVMRGGAFDPAALERVAAALDRAGQQTRLPVQRLLRANPGPTLPAVSAGVIQAQDQLHDLPETLTAAGMAVRALHGLVGADGTRRLLVVLENNAELRGTGGLVSVFAQTTSSQGRIQLGRFQDVDAVATSPRVATPQTVPAPADYSALWGPYLANTTLWKNVNMSPDVPSSSSVLAALAAASTGETPDAVLWLDVPAIAAIVGATGDVTLADGTVLTESNTVNVLLADVYADAGDDSRSQGLRRERLRAVADAVVSRLLEGDPDVVRLASALTSSARGRHLALWSHDPQEQLAWIAAGLSGEMAAGAGDISAFTVNNLGGGDTDGNKLDLYARRKVSVRTVVGREQAAVTQTVVLRNTAPASGLPSYVLGGGSPGQTNNLVSIALPTAAQGPTLERDGTVVTASVRPEGDHTVITDVIPLPSGTSATWTLRYRLPVVDGSYTLRVVPQPLAVDADVTVDVTAANGLQLAGRTSYSEPLTEQLEVQATATRKGVLSRWGDAVHRFWTDPVSLPG